MRVNPCAVAVLAIIVSTADAQPVPARWSVDARPTLTIGQSEADTNDLLAAVEGATRLPDGRILVGDRGSFALRVFSPNGKPERAFGRKGQGPGEITHLKSMLRCGDSIVTLDIDGQRTSVFSLDGKFVRMFRFGSPQAARAPYRTACNDRGMFAHHGWETLPDMRGGAYRATVPFWLSGADSAVRRVVGSFPGSERFGTVVNGQIRGSRPLPLGKQPAIALGTDRLYIGSADRYEINAYDLAGAPVAAIRGDYAPRPFTDEDIANAKELEIAGGGDRVRAAVDRAWATMPIPKAPPAYADFVVDNAQNLWVQDYPRARAPTVAWRVFGRDGRPIARVDLPTHLHVYEIGADYVLGRYLDPDELIPQVRLYRLTRGPR